MLPNPCFPKQILHSYGVQYLNLRIYYNFSFHDLEEYFNPHKFLVNLEAFIPQIVSKPLSKSIWLSLSKVSCKKPNITSPMSIVLPSCDNNVGSSTSGLSIHC